MNTWTEKSHQLCRYGSWPARAASGQILRGEGGEVPPKKDTVLLSEAEAAPNSPPRKVIQLAQQRE